MLYEQFQFFMKKREQNQEKQNKIGEQITFKVSRKPKKKNVYYLKLSPKITYHHFPQHTGTTKLSKTSTYQHDYSTELPLDFTHLHTPGETQQNSFGKLKKCSGMIGISNYSSV